MTATQRASTKDFHDDLTLILEEMHAGSQKSYITEPSLREYEKLVDLNKDTTSNPADCCCNLQCENINLIYK